MYIEIEISTTSLTFH